MPNFRPYSRRRLRALFFAWARRHGRYLLIFALIIFLGLLAVTLSVGVFGTQTPGHWYLLGALQSGLVLLACGGVLLLFFAHEGEAVIHLRGAWGEEQTREELRRAQAKKLIWGWVDSLTLEFGDIDHLVVTRDGGMVAIDSKWRTSASGGREQLIADALRMRMRAEGVVRSLVRRERAGHRDRSQAITVRPLVVIWGAAQRELAGQHSGPVPLVQGPELVGWLGQLSGQPVDEDAAADMLRRLNKQREASWGRA